MDKVSLSKAKGAAKTINAILLEGLVITAFFLLFHWTTYRESPGGLRLVLLLLFPFSISICTGVVIATVAEKKGLSARKWGLLASGLTLILMLSMVCIPTMWSGLSFILAPFVVFAVSGMLMNSEEKAASE